MKHSLIKFIIMLIFITKELAKLFNYQGTDSLLLFVFAKIFSISSINRFSFVLLNLLISSTEILMEFSVTKSTKS